MRVIKSVQPSSYRTPLEGWSYFAKEAGVINFIRALNPVHLEIYLVTFPRTVRVETKVAVKRFLEAKCTMICSIGCKM